MKIGTKLQVLALVPFGVGTDVGVEVAALVFGLQLVEAHGIECKGAHGVHEYLDAPDFALVPAEAA